jgi:hypothetical protein
MGAGREKVQADFDLERFIDMFDEALTSNDERVINALRSLMMMVVLTKPESRYEGHDRNSGPLRQLYDDLYHLNRRMYSIEENVKELDYRTRPPVTEKSYTARDYWPQGSEKITMDDKQYKQALRNINSPGKLTKP